MDVLLLASQPLLKRLKRESSTVFNPKRYNSFKEVFGEENYGFVLAGDVQKEIRAGKKAQVYKFGDNLYPYEAEKKGVDCRLLFASSFGCTGGYSGTPFRFPRRDEVDEIMSYFEEKRDKGDIGHFVNSKKGTLYEDKISLLELQVRGINLPKTFHFESFSDFRDFVNDSSQNNKEYVVKHRFGQEGEQLFLVNKDNIESFASLDVENYILQEKVDILDEKRLIFFKGELLGARRIFDRHMPWEEEGKAGRKHLNEKYVPSPEEVSETRSILRDFDSILGCVDWINVNGERLFMEFNGAGTGWGGPGDHYDLNKVVPERLKENFL